MTFLKIIVFLVSLILYGFFGIAYIITALVYGIIYLSPMKGIRAVNKSLGLIFGKDDDDK